MKMVGSKKHWAVLGMMAVVYSTATLALEYSAPKMMKAKDLVVTTPEAKIYDLKSLDTQFTSWGIEYESNASINLNDAWKKFHKKKEIVVAVIDTGIDPDHPFLNKNISVPSGTMTSTNYGMDFSKGAGVKTTPMDEHGHGTHVSGIIKSIYPEVKILALKYYNPKASGTDNLNSTIDALRYAVEQNVDVINYSGGGPEPALEEMKILKEAERKGILVVAAAGNEESDIDNKKNAYYPASYGLTNIITVTAYDQSITTLPSSNYGKQSVHISAPGYRIKSTMPFGRSGYLTGTSQATAFVSGVAAMIKSQFPNLPMQKIKDAIIESAKKEKSLEGKCLAGGRLDASRAQELAAGFSGEKLDGATPVRNIAASKKPGRIIYRKALVKRNKK
jgi:subtilisin family serine protease